jgi:hypothetical protein
VSAKQPGEGRQVLVDIRQVDAFLHGHIEQGAGVTDGGGAAGNGGLFSGVGLTGYGLRAPGYGGSSPAPTRNR